MATTTPLTSVSGLISGLDTSSIITQLMQIEAQPQTALKTTLSTTQTAITSYQDLNTKFKALLASAQKLTDPSTWGARTASSSDSSVAASATPSALAGSVTFTVNGLATAQSLISASSTSSLTDTSTFSLSGGSFSIVGSDGTTTTLTPADGSLQSVVSAVNSSTAGVRAAAVQVSPGQYRLQLTSTTTGAASTFTVNGLNGLGGTTVVADARDASIHVGSPTQGFDVTSSSNTFTGVSPGLTFTVSQAGATSTVTVGNDEKSIGSAVSALVDAANAVLADITTQTAQGTLSSDGKTRTGQGALATDTTVKNLTSAVLQAVTSAVGGVSAATYGIQSTSDGKLTFDADTFAAAYGANPAGTQAALAPVGGTGVAQRLAAVAQQASDPVTGTITTSIASQTSTVTQLNNQISDWDVRLAARQQTLQNQFNAMEVALQKLQSQSSWLSSQLNGLSGLVVEVERMMARPDDPTARYVQDSVGTASPGRLLVMLYDRLALDLVQAGEALARSDRSTAHERLIHAQRIVAELAATLDHSAGWSGSSGLASLYAWLTSELVWVNIKGDAARLHGCRLVVEPLRDTWRAALLDTAPTGTDDRLVG